MSTEELLEHRIGKLADGIAPAATVLRNISTDAIATIEILNLNGLDIVDLFTKIARCDYTKMLLVLRCHRFGILRKETITNAIQECLMPPYQPVSIRFSNKLFGRLALKLMRRETNDGRRPHLAKER